MRKFVAFLILALIASAAVADEVGPRRVVSTAPALTEMVWAAGAIDRLVAVSDYCRFPPEVRRLPKIGGLLNFNYELIRRLEPDLVLLMYPGGDAARRLERMGIAYGVFANETFDEIRGSVKAMCDMFGHEAECRRFFEQWDSRIRAIRNRYLHAKPGPKVMVVVGREAGRLSGLYVAGKGSFYHEILSMLKCSNAFGNIRRKYFQPSLEAIAQARPDVIIEIWAGKRFTEQQKERLVADWSAMKLLPAVRSGRIHIVTEDYAGIPSARATMTLELFEKLIRGAP